jgi:hypothetical protein
MARGKAGTTRVETRTEQGFERRADAAPVVVEEEMTMAEAAGFGMLSKLLGEQAVKCMLRRRNEETKKWEFQDTFPVEEFAYEMVRDVYGGGEYQVQGLAEDSAFVKSFTFSIDARYIGKKWTHPAASPAIAAAHGDSTALIAMALDKMAEAITALKNQPVPPPPPQIDPMALIERLATTMKALRPDPIPAPPQADFAQQLTTAKTLVDLGKSLVGDGEGGGGGNDYMSVVSKLADPVIDLVRTQAARERLGAAPVRRALPSGNKVTTPATGPVPEQPAPSPAPAGGAAVSWIGEIQRYIPLIVKRQQKGASAESTAFFVLDELSPATLDSLTGFLEQEGSDEQLQRVLPAELRNNPQWLGEFLTAVRDYLFGPEEEGAEEAEDETDRPPVVLDIAQRAQEKLGKLADNPDKKKEEPPKEPEASAP